MELVKESGEHKIYKKRNGRYCVKKDGKYVNGDTKRDLLLAESLIKVSKANPSAAKEEEAPAEEASAESAE